MTITDSNTNQLKAYYISDVTDLTEWSGNATTTSDGIRVYVVPAYWEKYSTASNFTLNCSISSTVYGGMGFKTPEGNRLMIAQTSGLQYWDSSTDTLVVQRDTMTGEYVFSCADNVCILKDIANNIQYDSFEVPTGSQFFIIGFAMSARAGQISLHSLTYQSTEVSGTNTEQLTTDTNGTYTTGYKPLYYGDRSLLSQYDGTNNYNPDSTSLGLKAAIELDYIQADFTGLHEIVSYNRDISGSNPSVSDGCWYSGTYIFSRWDVQPTTSNCIFTVTLQTTTDNRWHFGFHDPTGTLSSEISVYRDTGSATVTSKDSTGTQVAQETVTIPSTSTTYRFVFSDNECTLYDDTNSATYSLGTLDEGLYFWIRKWSTGNIIVSSLEYYNTG